MPDTYEALITCYLLWLLLLLLTDEMTKAKGQEGTCSVSRNKPAARREIESKFSDFWLPGGNAGHLFVQTLPCSLHVPGAMPAAGGDTEMAQAPSLQYQGFPVQKEKSSLSANLDYRGREVLFSAGRDTQADNRAVRTVLAWELETPGRATLWCGQRASPLWSPHPWLQGSEQMLMSTSSAELWTPKCSRSEWGEGSQTGMWPPRTLTLPTVQIFWNLADWPTLFIKGMCVLDHTS